jgi:DNA-3-methyladenine glycosylase I
MENQMVDGLITDPLGVTRCAWCGVDADYQLYHDAEWGVPINDDRVLFQKICLEGFQAGLSWLTILRKRNNFIKSFDNFDFYKISNYTENDVDRLLKDSSIVRHKGKIKSTINNALKAIELRNEVGSIASFVWSFEPDQLHRPPVFDYSASSKITQSIESIALSKALKKRGWSFVGPTICYSFMQAMGIVNDHLIGCGRRNEIEKLRNNFKRSSEISFFNDK